MLCICRRLCYHSAFLLVIGRSLFTSAVMHWCLHYHRLLKILLKLGIPKSTVNLFHLVNVANMSGKCWKCTLSGIIVWVSVILKRAVGGSDCRFGNLSRSHLQSQSDFVSSVDGIYVSADWPAWSIKLIKIKLTSQVNEWQFFQKLLCADQAKSLTVCSCFAPHHSLWESTIGQFRYIKNQLGSEA